MGPIDAILIPDNATNGDMIKVMFPDVVVQKIMGSFDKDKLLGYRTWLGGRSQDYLLDWWNAPYQCTRQSYDRSETVTITKCDVCGSDIFNKEEMKRGKVIFTKKKS